MSLSAMHPATNNGQAGWSIFYYHVLALVLLSGIDGNHGVDSPCSLSKKLQEAFAKRGRPADVPSFLFFYYSCNNET